MSVEEDRLWNIVRANSQDFNAWTALIEETEKVAEDNILKIRKVYDAFLVEFPLCYGYWEKYAHHEARFGSIDKAVEVYERAVQGATYSVDIWLHYFIFAISIYEDQETVRRLFERGLGYVGTDYLSFPLWDMYIEYEYTQGDWARLAMIYTKILENPNQQLDRYFGRCIYTFKELARKHPLSELWTADEVAAAAGAVSDAGSQAHPGEVHPDAAENSPLPATAGLTEEELENFIATREEMYKKAKEFDSKIIGFESTIRRPYFHVRPLNVAELENWHSYLDFIEREGGLSKQLNGQIELKLKHGPSIWFPKAKYVKCQCYACRRFSLANNLSQARRVPLFSLFEGPLSQKGVVKLYERCVIACANYPEYWVRYALCMEASGSMELANNVLSRATNVFVKMLPKIHLFSARFKEKNGDIAGARAAYQLVHSEISPGLLEAITRHANMENRLGKFKDACSLYEQAVATEKVKERSLVLSMLFAQYSRFVFLATGSAEKARKILVDGLEHVQMSRPLLEVLLHLEAIQPIQKQADISFLDSLVVKFIAPNSESASFACETDREALSSIFLEFLDLFGDVQTIKIAEDRHAKLFLPHRSMSELKKRHAEDYLASDKTKVARSYPVQSPAQALVGAYPNSQNQWAASFGVQPRAWPPATQAQGQQYTAGYTQQAAYGAYAGYGGTFANSQLLTSVPQNIAYGAYPPTYPVQWGLLGPFPLKNQQAAYGAYAGYGGSYANSQLPTYVPQNTTYGAYPPTYPVQMAALLQQNYAQPVAAPAQGHYGGTYYPTYKYQMASFPLFGLM